MASGLSTSAEIAIAWAKAGVECNQINREAAITAIRSDLSRGYPDLEFDEETFAVKEKVNG